MAGSAPRRSVTLETETLIVLVRLLERLDIPYMLTGSVASSFHGRPRSNWREIADASHG